MGDVAEVRAWLGVVKRVAAAVHDLDKQIAWMEGALPIERLDTISGYSTYPPGLLETTLAGCLAARERLLAKVQKKPKQALVDYERWAATGYHHGNRDLAMAYAVAMAVAWRESSGMRLYFAQALQVLKPGSNWDAKLARLEDSDALANTLKIADDADARAQGGGYTLGRARAVVEYLTGIGDETLRKAWQQHKRSTARLLKDRSGQHSR